MVKTEIPGPKGHWLWGSFQDFQSNPLTFLAECQKSYGDFFSFRIGPISAYVVANPDYLYQVLVADADQFYKSSLQKRLVKEFLGNGLAMSEGEFWKNQRRLMQPAFHHQRIASYADVIVSQTQEMLDKWHDGETRQIAQDMQALTLNIVARTLFDADISEFAATVGVSVSIIQNILSNRARSPLHVPTWVPTQNNKKLLSAIQNLDEAVAKIIRDHRAAGRDKGDLLSMLLLAQDEETGYQMSDRQLRDEAITLLSAGHETTANLLVWAWHSLSENPEVQFKLADELRTVIGERPITFSDLPQLPYNEMVIKETLRMYPPLWLTVAREPITDITIGNSQLKKGSLLFISPYLVQHDSRYYDEPEVFRPERFEVEQEKQRPRYAYIPFGAGPRVCIGNSFAMMEARLILATIMQKYCLATVPNFKVELAPLVTLCPKNGLPMVATRTETQANLSN